MLSNASDKSNKDKMFIYILFIDAMTKIKKENEPKKYFIACIHFACCQNSNGKIFTKLAAFKRS